jgi:uncharacterized protein
MSLAEMKFPIAHRPYPPPRSPWLGHMAWNDVLFVHWPVPSSRLRPLVPACFPIDVLDGTAWLSIVAFWMDEVHPRTVPSLPILSRFAELNVRTYVTLDDKPGVYFFSLDAARLYAVVGARIFLSLPYFHARMSVIHDGNEIHYVSRRDGDGARFDALYHPRGAVSAPARGSLDEALLERFCLYTVGARGQPRRLEIHHPDWPLQDATWEIGENTMTVPLGLDLDAPPSLVHYAKRVEVVAWLPSRCDRALAA